MFKENQKAKSLSFITDYFSDSESNKNHEQTFKALSKVVKFLWIFLNKWKGATDLQADEGQNTGYSEHITSR